MIKHDSFELNITCNDRVVWEKLTVDDKLVLVFIHQTMRVSKITCHEETIIGRNNKAILYKSAEVHTSASA